MTCVQLINSHVQVGKSAIKSKKFATALLIGGIASLALGGVRLLVPSHILSPGTARLIEQIGVRGCKRLCISGGIMSAVGGARGIMLLRKKGGCTLPKPNYFSTLLLVVGVASMILGGAGLFLSANALPNWMGKTVEMAGIRGCQALLFGGAFLTVMVVWSFFLPLNPANQSQNSSFPSYNWRGQKILIDETNVNQLLHGSTAIHKAIENNNQALFDRICSMKSIDFNVKDAFGRTPLEFAILRQRESLTIKLLKQNNSPNIQDEDGKTPLHHAAIFGLKELASYLLSLEDTNPNTEDQEGETALSHAIFWEKEEIVKMLLANKRILFSGKIWLTAISEKNEPVLNLLLSRADANFNYKNQCDSTALHILAKSKDEFSLNTLKLLLKKEGIDLNAKDIYGRTPLEVAIASGNSEAENLLRSMQELI